VSRRVTTLVVASVLALVLAVGGAVMRVPYVALGPGPVTDTLGKRSDGVALIMITGRQTYPTSGHLDLTTVSVAGGPPDPINLATALRGWLDRSVAVVPQELVYPPQESSKEIEQQNTQDMLDSQQSATTAALRALSIPVGTSVAVRSVAKGKPADGRLKPEDVIRSVDGTAVTSTDELRKLISRCPPGSSLRLQVTRAGKPLTVELTTVGDPADGNRSVIGIEPMLRHVYPFKVSFGLRDVGGPSAGLMFALGIIDKLTPGPLTGGKFVAGTGEISDDGTVGPIGGIQQKIVAARRAGATIFLTPAANCAAASRNRPAGLQLVKVTKLADALSSLKVLSAAAAGAGVPVC
jgi:PDZ domain-containing protein